MKKMLSYLLIALMIIQVIPCSFAEEENEPLRLTDAYTCRQYAHFLYEIKDGQPDKAVINSGELPEGLGLEIHQLQLDTPTPEAEEYFWAISGKPLIAEDDVTFTVEYTNSAKNKVFTIDYIMSVKVKEVKLDKAEQLKLCKRKLAYMSGTGNESFEIAAGDMLPDGLSVTFDKEKSAWYLEGYPENVGTYTFRIKLSVFGNKYDNFIPFTINVERFRMPYPDECSFMSVVADDWDVSENWKTADCPESEFGKMLLAQSDEKCEALLISPKVLIYKNAELFWYDKVQGNGAYEYELYTCTEDTTDITKYIKAGDYATGAERAPHRYMFSSDAEQESAYIRFAFKFNIYKSDDSISIDTVSLTYGTKAYEDFAIECNTDVKLLLAEYDKDVNITWSGEKPLGTNISAENEDGNTKVYLQGKTEDEGIYTFNIKATGVNSSLFDMKSVRLTAGNPKPHLEDSVHGDANRDGSVNTADAVTILKKCAGMLSLSTYEEKLNSDITRDGEINTVDAVMLLKYASGMISTF